MCPAGVRSQASIRRKFPRLREAAEPFAILARLALYHPDLRQFLAISLADIENVSGPEASDRTGSLFLFLFVFRLPANDGSEDHDSLLALLHEAAQLVPGAEAGDMARIRFLGGDQQNVAEAECEFPDYVNSKKKAMVACIFLRSRVNIVRTISRPLAICALTWHRGRGFS